MAFEQPKTGFTLRVPNLGGKVAVAAGSESPG